MTEYKTFEDYSTQGLLNLADAFCMAMHGINNSRFRHDSLTLPAGTHAIISASPRGGLRVCMSDIEGVLEEGWRRVGAAKNPGYGIGILSELEYEMTKAISRHIQLDGDLPVWLRPSARHGNGRSSGNGAVPKNP